jgi:hypothetical protein
MKCIIAFVAALLFGMSTAQAQLVVWQGEAVIDQASAQCNQDAAIGPLPKVAKTVLRPKNVGTNGENTTVTFIVNQLVMFALILDHGAMPKGTGVAFGNDSSGVVQANVGIKYTSFRQKPGTIDAGTDQVTLSGTIKDFLYINRCDVSFRAAYSPRPE